MIFKKYSRMVILGLLVLASVPVQAHFGFSINGDGRGGMVINGDGRGGGDVIYCEANPEVSRFAGYYTLDYLLTREDYYHENSNEHFRFSNDAGSYEDIVKSIANKLEEVSPKAADSLRSFMDLVENRDWAVNVQNGELVRVWEPKVSLNDYKDEDFISSIPSNCIVNGAANIIQAVVREDVNSNILYHYNRKLFNQLKTTPIQMSYLLIHEWLRDYTVYTATIRRVVEYLHSEEFFAAPGYEAVVSISRMGLYFDQEVRSEPVVELMSLDTGVGCNGQCGFLDVAIKVKNIAYNKYVALYYSENGGPWNELPASYVRPLGHGYEEWNIQTNFARPGHTIEFAVKYVVDGQYYWDNNGGQNYRGTFRYLTTFNQ